MKTLIGVAMAALCAALSGCATIVDGSTQSVSVSTAPVQGAACTLTNSQGTWFVTSPGNAVVHKTKSDLTVTCKKDGYEMGSQVAVSKFGGATFGNIVAGGGIGAIVDAASGANYYYDSPLIVPLGESAKTAQASTPVATTKINTIAPACTHDELVQANLAKQNGYTSGPKCD